jgi:hypothetical protein
MKKKARSKVNPTVSLKNWLYGWKDIANYMGCDEKTSRFYEKEFSLPVRHLPNGKVIAHPNRIDEWIEQCENFKKR